MIFSVPSNPNHSPDLENSSSSKLMGNNILFFEQYIHQ